MFFSLSTTYLCLLNKTQIYKSHIKYMPKLFSNHKSKTPWIIPNRILLYVFVSRRQACFRYLNLFSLLNIKCFAVNMWTWIENVLNGSFISISSNILKEYTSVFLKKYFCYAHIRSWNIIFWFCNWVRESLKKVNTFFLIHNCQFHK